MTREGGAQVDDVHRPAAREVADVSVLLPVHAGVEPEHFAEALASLGTQTVTPAEVVVVLDGPLSAAHLEVLDRHPSARRVALSTNQGAGVALARGLAECRSTWVARADADDVNEPDRLERQLALLEASGADVCSAAMTEFAGSPDHVLGVRRCPTTHDLVARQLRTRNPVNHPTAVFRREAALRAGGYQPLPHLEDYDLWARMLRDGARFVGTDVPTVRFRTDGLMERRTSRAALDAERELQRRLRGYGVVGPARARVNLVLRGTYLRLPRPLLERVYRLVFRR